MLLEMKNGGIKDIYTDQDYTSGCETCDYGSSYVNEYTFYMTSGNIHIEVSQSYDYALSEGYMMKLMLNNASKIQAMTEDEFFEWLKLEVETEVGFTLDRCDFNKVG